MAMEDEVIINSIDVTDYRVLWKDEVVWENRISALTIELSSSVSEVLTLSTGLSITVKRGLVTPTDEFIFEGQITQVIPMTSTIQCVCKGKLYEAVKAARTKSWDKDIDPSGGVGSEIFKDICDNSGLSYTSTSIPSTGTSEAEKITKFIQNDEDDFQKMNELALRYNRTIVYNPEDSLVYFQPKGFTTYSKSLNVGVEIPSQIEWREDMEQLCNKVKILGATVYDKVVETFAGPASTFTLTKTPEDTEVRINHATTNDLQTRGQKDLGVLGTDFDYYIDVESKKIYFNSNVSDLWINYGSQVPIPVLVQDNASIETYGGPDETPHFKRFTYNDIKDIGDAEQRGLDILQKYSTPFLEAEEIPITDETRATYGNITPGMLVNIIDTYNDKNVNVFVHSVQRSFPHVHDKMTVGDEIWRTEDWQTDQMKKINAIYNELNKNQDILVSVLYFNRQKRMRRRYAYREKKIVTAPAFVVGHPDFSIVGTEASGGSQVGDSSASSWVVQELLQGHNVLEEYIQDSTFIDTGTATVNTTTNVISFTDGQVLNSELISIGNTVSGVDVTMYFTGTLLFEITADGSNWETVTLTSGTTATHTFTNTGSNLKYRITSTGVSTISTQKNILEKITAPGIKIGITYS